MHMIYITGDCHREFGRFSTKNFPEQKEMTKDDFVIICGDFGAIWDKEESKEEKYYLDWLNNKPFTTLFIDGNHENFDRLHSYPVTKWHGGKVHEIRPSILHLMRGQVFNINGKSIFAFGGARSNDISGGILDPDDPDFKKKKKELDQGWMPYRINHTNWWQEELASKAEMEEGWKNLAAHDYKVDYIVSHCCATSTQLLLNPMCMPDAETDYLEDIRQKVDFRRWFFGHYHDNRYIASKEVLLYEQIIRL